MTREPIFWGLHSPGFKNPGHIPGIKRRGMYPGCYAITKRYLLFLLDCIQIIDRKSTFLNSLRAMSGVTVPRANTCKSYHEFDAISACFRFTQAL
jgi:hypothetical protein